MHAPPPIPVSRTRPRQVAFTLMEQLLVVALIGILAVLLLPALSAVRTRAKRQVALHDVKQLSAGFRAFNSDQTLWPIFKTEDPGSAGWGLVPHYSGLGYSPQQVSNFFLETADLPLTDALLSRLQLGLDRSIRYYITLDKVNLVTNTSPASNVVMIAMADPWRNPYMVRFDYNGDGSIPNPFAPDTTTVVRTTVLIWSAGPDGHSDTTGESSTLNKDNIKSW